ncbi:MAG: glycosyltransferase [Oscillospiraceae bacterium]
MTFDFCFATYNSEKWLNSCVKALAQQDFNLKNVSLYFADNASTDATVQELERLKNEYKNVFANFEILPQPENKGFGTASNAAAREGSGDFVFFYNVDTEMFPDALTKLSAEIDISNDTWGAFEMRQFPYEHPKYYNPVTMETSWASGAVFIIPRMIFEKTGGFDETIFMYGEDVELSWRIRLLGYKIKYVPTAVTNHYAYKEAGEVKPNQLAGSLTGNLVLRYKYGSEDDIAEWKKLIDISKEHWRKINGVEESIEKQIVVINKNKKLYRAFYKSNVKNTAFTPSFLEFDYEFARKGAFYVNKPLKSTVFFSIIVRTYQRPDVLRLTLKSLCNQTYKNFEVILVEDGEKPVSQSVADEFAQKLNLKYIIMNESSGRCRAGNCGAKAANGDFLMFLDDDDYYFAEHLEVLAAMHNEKPNAEVLATAAIQGKCKKLNDIGDKFAFTEKINIGKDTLKIIDFCADNPLPIQAIAFSKHLATTLGCMDESLDALEDWDMWVKFVSTSEMAYTPKATSIYKIPADEKEFEARNEFIGMYRKKIYEKFSDYGINVTAQDIYGLFYKEEDSWIEQLEKSESRKKAILESAIQVYNSTSWKATKPLRFIPRMIAEIVKLFLWACNQVAFVAVQIFTFVGKVISFGLNSVVKFADWIGPKKPNFNKPNEIQLHNFVVLSQKSLSMKLAKILQNLRK